MNERPSLDDLHAFATIVRFRSFRQAADELALAPSTLSHLMRALEKRMGTRLLHRTTRSVAPTDAGNRLLARLQPLLLDLDNALAEAGAVDPQPSGVLRLNTSEIAARVLLQKIVPTYLRRYPRMSVDLVTDGRLVDIVADGFDAGVRLGEAVPQDMVAVSFSGPLRFVAVAAPSYLKKHPAPQTPEDLHQHACIRFRMSSGKRFRWEFVRRRKQLSIDVPGALTLDHVDLMAQAAADGLGIAYVMEYTARPWIARGKLVTVLDEWCPSTPGMCLYYPGHRQVPASLQAFVEVLREFPVAP